MKIYENVSNRLGGRSPCAKDLYSGNAFVERSPSFRRGTTILCPKFRWQFASYSASAGIRTYQLRSMAVDVFGCSKFADCQANEFPWFVHLSLISPANSSPRSPLSLNRSRIAFEHMAKFSYQLPHERS